MIRMLLTNGRTLPVRCEERYCPQRDAVVTIRIDTRAVVSNREAKDDERQLPLPFARENYTDDESGHVRGPVRRRSL